MFWYDKSNGFIDNRRSEFTFRNGVTVNNDRYAGEDYNEEETQGARVSLLVDLTDNWKATLSAFTQSLDAVGSWNHDPTRRGDLEVTRFGPEWREVDSDQLGFTLSGETGIGDLIYAVSYYDRQDFAGERLLGLRRVRFVRELDPAARLRGLLLVRLHGLRRSHRALRGSTPTGC